MEDISNKKIVHFFTEKTSDDVKQKLSVFFPLTLKTDLLVFIVC